MNETDLERAILTAHDTRRSGDLARLYQQAADQREQAGDIDAACFLLTHAYVFALEHGADTRGIHHRLKAHGREE